MSGSNGLKLQALIVSAVNEDATASAEDLARTFFEKEAGLIQAWALERLTSLVRAEQRARPDPNQLFLPGFKDLSRKLPLEDGFVKLRDATISVLRKSAAAIQEASKSKVDPKAAKLYVLIDAMAPFAKNKHGITVERFYELRALDKTPSAIAKKAAEARWGPKKAGGKKAGRKG